MEEYIGILREGLANWGGMFLFPLLLLENFPFLGFVTPATTLLIVVGFLFFEQQSYLLQMTLVCYLAVMSGDFTWFMLGRCGAASWSLMRRVRENSQVVLEELEEMPRWVMLVYQFPLYFRMFLPFALGMSRFDLARWIRICPIASLLYVSAFIGLGATVGRIYNDVDRLSSVGSLVSLVILLASALYLVRLSWRIFRRHQRIRRQCGSVRSARLQRRVRSSRM